MSDSDARPRVTDEQLLQLRGWGASHRQIGAMLGLRRNTVSVRFSRIDRARRAQAADVDVGDGEHGGEGEAGRQLVGGG